MATENLCPGPSRPAPKPRPGSAARDRLQRWFDGSSHRTRQLPRECRAKHSAVPLQRPADDPRPRRPHRARIVRPRRRRASVHERYRVDRRRPASTTPSYRRASRRPAARPPRTPSSSTTSTGTMGPGTSSARPPRLRGHSPTRAPTAARWRCHSPPAPAAARWTASSAASPPTLRRHEPPHPRPKMAASDPSRARRRHIQLRR
jgi:hypothetical protein